jgi:hypothetical protein
MYIMIYQSVAKQVIEPDFQIWHSKFGARIFLWMLW